MSRLPHKTAHMYMCVQHHLFLPILLHSQEFHFSKLYHLKCIKTYSQCLARRTPCTGCWPREYVVVEHSSNLWEVEVLPSMLGHSYNCAKMNSWKIAIFSCKIFIMPLCSTLLLYVSVWKLSSYIFTCLVCLLKPKKQFKWRMQPKALYLC